MIWLVNMDWLFEANLPTHRVRFDVNLIVGETVQNNIDTS